jgi:hypothetical protein
MAQHCEVCQKEVPYSAAPLCKDCAKKQPTYRGTPNAGYLHHRAPHEEEPVLDKDEQEEAAALRAAHKALVAAALREVDDHSRRHAAGLDDLESRNEKLEATLGDEAKQDAQRAAREATKAAKAGDRR